MKSFFEKKEVVLFIRISGWISLGISVIITFGYPQLFAEHKFLVLILIITNSLSDYKKDYKNMPAAKRALSICGWLLFYCICLFAAFCLS